MCTTRRLEAVVDAENGDREGDFMFLLDPKEPTHAVDEAHPVVCVDGDSALQSASSLYLRDVRELIDE